MSQEHDPRRIVSWRRRWIAAFLMVFLATSRPAVGGEGLLQAARTDVREPSIPEPSQPAEERRRNTSRRPDEESPYDESSTESPFKNWLLPAAFGLGMVAASPILGPRYLLLDEGDVGHYPRFPYEGGLPGYLMIEPEVPLDGFPWSTRIRTEYADNFDDLSLIGGRLLYELSTPRFGADVAMNYRREALAAGAHDSVWTGDTNLVYRFAQSENWQFRAGVGANWLADSRNTEWGYNLTYQFDWFPSQPWVISAELDWGEVGHAHLLHLRSTIGCQIRGVEVYTGYDHFDLGPSVLNGLVAGLEFWF
ncbi:MAG: hypothetical protein AB7F89_18325 [Pirellulaceae bacterium]